jgi:TonB family protein
VAHLLLQQSSALHRLVSIALVALLHAVVVVVLLNAGFRTRPTFDQEMMTVAMTNATPETFTAPPMPVPELDDQEPKDLPSTQAFVVQLPLPDEVPVDSAPVLATELSPDEIKSLSQLAQLQPGEQFTVVLRIDVTSIGQPGSVAVEKSGGTVEIDAAAIAYAQRLIWIPGYRSGTATAMTVRMVVHLTG